MGIVLVFDADDTLWMTEWMYSKSRADLFSYLYSEFTWMMPDFNSLTQRYNEIEGEFFEEWGVKKGKVSMQMLGMYRELLKYFEKKFGGEFLPDKKKQIAHERKIFELGEEPFDFKALNWMEPAKGLIEDLSGREGYELCLLTSYDENVWAQKSTYLGVEKYFRRVRVTNGKKTKEDFVEVAGYRRGLGQEKRIFYAIGNGNSDILPALDISEKWRGIYIPHRSTSPLFNALEAHTEYILPPMNNPRVFTLYSIGELKDFDFLNFKPKKQTRLAF